MNHWHIVIMTEEAKWYQVETRPKFSSVDRLWWHSLLQKLMLSQYLAMPCFNTNYSLDWGIYCIYFFFLPSFTTVSHIIKLTFKHGKIKGTGLIWMTLVFWYRQSFHFRFIFPSKYGSTESSFEPHFIGYKNRNKKKNPWVFD